MNNNLTTSSWIIPYQNQDSLFFFSSRAQNALRTFNKDALQQQLNSLRQEIETFKQECASVKAHPSLRLAVEDADSIETARDYFFQKTIEQALANPKTELTIQLLQEPHYEESESIFTLWGETETKAESRQHIVTYPSLLAFMRLEWNRLPDISKVDYNNYLLDCNQLGQMESKCRGLQFNLDEFAKAHAFSIEPAYYLSAFVLEWWNRFASLLSSPNLPKVKPQIKRSIANVFNMEEDNKELVTSKFAKLVIPFTATNFLHVTCTEPNRWQMIQTTNHDMVVDQLNIPISNFLSRDLLAVVRLTDNQQLTIKLTALAKTYFQELELLTTLYSFTQDPIQYLLSCNKEGSVLDCGFCLKVKGNTREHLMIHLK